jgi:hypothetical protein
MTRLTDLVSLKPIHIVMVSSGLISFALAKQTSLPCLGKPTFFPLTRRHPAVLTAGLGRIPGQRISEKSRNATRSEFSGY